MSITQTQTQTQPLHLIALLNSVPACRHVRSFHRLVRSSLLVFVVLFFAADVSSGELAYMKSIGTGPFARQDLVVVKLDDDVCAETRPGFEDIRVYAQDGQVVPFILDRAVSVQQLFREVTSWGTIASLKQLQNNRIELIVHPPRMSTKVSAVAIRSPLQNFEKTVSVEGGSDGSWTALAQESAIFDYSRFADVRNLRVMLTPHDAYQRYRFTFSDVTDMTTSALMQITRTRDGGTSDIDQETTQSMLSRRDFRVNGISFIGYTLRTGQTTPITEDRDLPIIGREADADKKTTALILDAHMRPIMGLKIQVSDKNYGREISIEAGTKGPGGLKWRRFCSKRIESISFRGIERSTEKVDFPETRCDALKVVFHDGDSTPLDVTGITGILASYRAWFLGERGNEYQLRFGGRYVDKATFDTHFLATLKQESGHTASAVGLGPLQEASDFSPDSFVRRLLESRLALGLAALLALAVVGVSVFRALRTIDLSADDGGSGDSPK